MGTKKDRDGKHFDVQQAHPRKKKKKKKKKKKSKTPLRGLCHVEVE